MKMNNRYLFKAKRLDNGEWVTGHLITDEQDDSKCFIAYVFGTDEDGHPHDNDAVLVDDSTICQCTGLKDNNGNLIWENDIVSCLAEECCGYIGWNESEAGFYFNILLENGRFEEEHIYDYQDDIEIIGNIFDNPELLESEEI